MANYGPELVLNGGFVGNADGWDLPTGNVAYGDNDLVYTPDASSMNATQFSLVFLNGRTYHFSIFLSGTGTFQLIAGDGSVFEITDPDGTYTFDSVVETNSNNGIQLFSNGDYAGTVTDVSVKLVLTAGDVFWNSQFVFADTDGDVQSLNAGFTDNGRPIFYELETQEIDFGNRMHLKKISDRIVVFAKDAAGSQLSALQGEGTMKPIPIDLSGRVNIGEDINLEAPFFIFRWQGQSDSVSPVFEGILIDKVTDLGMTYG